MGEIKKIQILFRATIRFHRRIKAAAKVRAITISKWMREAVEEKLAREVK